MRERLLAFFQLSVIVCAMCYYCVGLGGEAGAAPCVPVSSTCWCAVSVILSNPYCVWLVSSSSIYVQYCRTQRKFKTIFSEKLQCPITLSPSSHASRHSSYGQTAHGHTRLPTRLFSYVTLWAQPPLRQQLAHPVRITIANMGEGPAQSWAASSLVQIADGRPLWNLDV
jgi:hypothetical protein